MANDTITEEAVQYDVNSVTAWTLTDLEACETYFVRVQLVKPVSSPISNIMMATTSYCKQHYVTIVVCLNPGFTILEKYILCI